MGLEFSMILNTYAVSHHCLGWNPGWECETVASDLGLGSGFHRFTPVSSTSYNWLVTN